MKRFTIQDVVSWGPCPPYTRARIKRLWAGCRTLTALEILDLDIPAEDRLWAVLREEVMPACDLRYLAAHWASEALRIASEATGKPSDPRSTEAVEVATLATLATWAAAKAAAWAAREAAWASAWAAWAAEIEGVREMLRWREAVGPDARPGA